MDFGLLEFEPGFSVRPWGGTRLRDGFGLPTPDDAVIGEAWLLSDHRQHESVVAAGPRKGQSLRGLMAEDAPALLGARPRPTPEGRFPLLLKLIDAAQPLSVQVHPDDAAAARLGEPDVGKTEMWHVLEAAPGSELICGLRGDAARGGLAQAVQNASLEQLMTRFPVAPGDSVFVPAGTVHAIGAGIVLAEIQQNSDLTYRLYDWGRLGPGGAPRELHVEKALGVIHFDRPHPGPAPPLAHEVGGAVCALLGACPLFAAERIEVRGTWRRVVHGATFHIVLGVQGVLEVLAAEGHAVLEPGRACLIPGRLDTFEVQGDGCCLDFYVPDLEADIRGPLAAAGHPAQAIARLTHD